MKVRIWGVRGSVVCPGPETVQFGGNTACLELRFGAKDRLIIIDAGSGIRLLGEQLIQHDLPQKPINAEIFITHTHWDHILGFPSFEPIYVPGTKLKVYSPLTHEEDSLDKILGDLFRYRHWPVLHNELAADIEYCQLKECEMDLGDGITLKTKYLNHPALSLGYRFECQGKVVCTAYDTEPFRNVFATDPNAPDFDRWAFEEGQRAVKNETEKLLDFYQGADILIHDSQYVLKEYVSSKEGWGHSSYEYAIDTAIKAQVKQVILFHHDPQRTDKELAALEAHYRTVHGQKAAPGIYVAREGMEFDL